MAVTREMKNGS